MVQPVIRKITYVAVLCLLSCAFNCASVNWTFLSSVQRFQFFIWSGLLFFTDFHWAFSQWCILLQVRNLTVKFKQWCNCMLSVRCHYNTTPVTPCSTEHFLKCFLTVGLRANCLSHKPQEYCLYSKCTGWWCLNSDAVQKRFGHSLQTYWSPVCHLGLLSMALFSAGSSHICHLAASV